MVKVNIHEAKTHLSRLVDQAVRGEPFVIAQAGHPVALVAPYESAPPPRQPGSMRGKIWIEPDFDTLPAAVLAAMEGQEM